MADVIEKTEEEILKAALEFLKGYPQFQLVAKHFYNRARQTELAVETAKNDELLEARGRWKEAKLIVKYLNK